MIPCPNGCGREFDTRPRMSGHTRWCDGSSYAPHRETKRCAKCSLSKPVSMFRVMRVTADGFKQLDAYCRLCERRRVRDGVVVRERRKCPACKKRKAAVAFRMGSEVCRKCCPTERVKLPTTIPHSYRDRPSLGEWLTMHRVTPAEHATLEAAFLRYGKSTQPCADEVIEAYCGPETYTPGGPMRRSAVLRHAVVLLANERARENGEKVRMRYQGRAA